MAPAKTSNKTRPGKTPLQKAANAIKNARKKRTLRSRRTANRLKKK